MISFKDSLGGLEVWGITPPLPAIGRQPEIAARITIMRRDTILSHDLTREEVARVILELQAVLAYAKP